MNAREQGEIVAVLNALVFERAEQRGGNLHWVELSPEAVLATLLARWRVSLRDGTNETRGNGPARVLKLRVER